MSGLPIFTKTSFTAGEVDVDLAGRGDLALYANGARALRNVVVAPIGGVRRRPGLRHVAISRGAGRLIAFEFNTEQTYLLVLSDGWLDIYAEGDKVAELATPWSEAQIVQLNWTQSADTLLVVHPHVPPRKITRTGANAWSIAEWSYYEEDGILYLPTHKFADDMVTLSPSGTSGSITLTASAPVFDAAHVGMRFRVGAFKSVAVVDGETYVLVERDGRHVIECFDDGLNLDAALVGSRETPSATWSGLDHLNGKSVRVLMDGTAIAEVMVTGGQIILPHAAATIEAGLAYAHRIEPLPPQAGVGQPMAAGKAVRLVQACFRVLDTKALHIDTGRGATPIPFRRRGPERFATRPPAFSGDVKVRAIGWTRDVMQPLWRIEQDLPLACTVISVSTEIKGAD